MVWDPSNPGFPWNLTHFRMVFGFVKIGVNRRRESFFPWTWLELTMKVFYHYWCFVPYTQALYCLAQRNTHNTLTPEKKNPLMVTTNDIRQFVCQSHAHSLAPRNKNRCSVTTPAWKQWWCSRSSWARFLALLDQIPNSWAQRCFGVQTVPTVQLKQQRMEDGTGTRTYDAFWPVGGNFCTEEPGSKPRQEAIMTSKNNLQYLFTRNHKLGPVRRRNALKWSQRCVWWKPGTHCLANEAILRLETKVFGSEYAGQSTLLHAQHAGARLTSLNRPALDSLEEAQATRSGQKRPKTLDVVFCFFKFCFRVCRARCFSRQRVSCLSAESDD